jgi:CheY-like chemotaxis protein
MQAKILIVEDDAYMVRLYQRLLEYEQLDVSVAPNGQVGIDMAVQVQPALIMMDVMMPVMNGLDALKILKQSDVTKNIPVLMLTNLNDAENIQKAKDLGAVDYLLKSNFQSDYIMAAIRKYIPNPAALTL